MIINTAYTPYEKLVMTALDLVKEGRRIHYVEVTPDEAENIIDSADPEDIQHLEIDSFTFLGYIPVYIRPDV